MRARRILLIEDEQDIADLVALHLSEFCDALEHAGDGNRGLQLALEKSWDLIILDLRLPGIDGLEICRQLRINERYQPILMLTAKASELDRVLGLETGADDYLTKPFSVLELVARVRALFRRIDNLAPRPEASQHTVQVGALSINPERREVSLDGRSIDLTAREFDLLTYFARHPGRVFRRSDLLDAVWGYGHDGYEHTVNSHINRLRSKIEADPANPSFIVTVWGVGYKLGGADTNNMTAT